MSDLIKSAHVQNTMRGLAAALGIDGHKDNDPASMQRLITVLGRQMLVLCQHLVEQGICHRDIKPGNLLICPLTQQVLAFAFGVSAFSLSV